MGTPDVLFIYLHGFASGPGSNKARAFRKRFSEINLPLLVPDLENGDFRNLTLSRQMDVIRWLIHRNPARKYGLIGSSMGGYLAALTAQLQPRVRALYLMCPGFDFVQRWETRIKKEYPYHFRSPGLIPLFNYRYNKVMDFSTGLFEDARLWEQVDLGREVPTRLVHGLQDDIVDIENSRNFVRNKSWAELVELDSDHGLLSHLDWILEDSIRFFRASGLLGAGWNS